MANATFIQSYGNGYIARNGDQYEYKVKEEVVGSYKTVEELVAANPVHNGKPSRQTEGSMDAALSTNDVASKADAKGTKKGAKAQKAKS
jgi:hypothetical protein